MTQLLSDVVAQEDRYAEALKRHLVWLEHGADLGAGGVANWTREDLLER